MNHWNEYDEDEDTPNPKTPQHYTDWDDEYDE